MRRIFLLAAFLYAIAAASAQPLQNTLIQPDCLVPFTFTAAGNSPTANVTNAQNDNRTRDCAAWTLMYQSTGLVMVTVTLQSGCSTSTTVSYGSFAGAISMGYTNGIVSDTGGSLQATNGTACISWVRVNVAATGTGTLTGVLYGFRNSSAAVNGGGGSGGPTNCLGGTAGDVELFGTSTTLECLSEYRIQSPFVGVSNGYSSLFGINAIPTLTSTTAAGTGTLSLGTHKWCITSAGVATGPSAGTGVNYGETLCSAVVTAVVANQATQGKQTLAFAGSGSYYDSIFIYRSDDGGATYSYDTSVSANVTSYDDAGDTLNATRHPPTADGSYIEAVGIPFNNGDPYWVVELPGSGNGDVFWGLNSCLQYNVNPDSFILSTGVCDWNGPSGQLGNTMTSNPGNTNGFEFTSTVMGGLAATFDQDIKSVGYQSSDGSPGTTGNGFKNGLCVTVSGACVGGAAFPAGTTTADEQCWASASTFGVCANTTISGRATEGSVTLTADVVNPFIQAKNSQTATAPGAAKCDVRLLTGTIGSSGKIVINCGTSATEVTIADNIGTGF